MHRRNILTAAVGLLSLLFWKMIPNHEVAAESGKIATLEEQLKNGLKARRQGEFAFIGRVVKLVEEGVLSEKLVKSTFNWARSQGDRRYPYIYFNRGLKLRAARLGITVK